MGSDRARDFDTDDPSYRSESGLGLHGPHFIRTFAPSSAVRRVETPRHQGSLAQEEQPTRWQIRARYIRRRQSLDQRRAQRAQIDTLRVRRTSDKEEKPSAIRKELRKSVTELTRSIDVGHFGNAASGSLHAAPCSVRTRREDNQSVCVPGPTPTAGSAGKRLWQPSADIDAFQLAVNKET